MTSGRQTTRPPKRARAVYDKVRRRTDNLPPPDGWAQDEKTDWMLEWLTKRIIAGSEFELSVYGAIYSGGGDFHWRIEGGGFEISGEKRIETPYAAIAALEKHTRALAAAVDEFLAGGEGLGRRVGKGGGDGMSYPGKRNSLTGAPAFEKGEIIAVVSRRKKNLPDGLHNRIYRLGQVKKVHKGGVIETFRAEPGGPVLDAWTYPCIALAQLGDWGSHSRLRIAFEEEDLEWRRKDALLAWLKAEMPRGRE